MGMIIRNDDVSVNTDFKELFNTYSVISQLLQEAEIWSCVTVLSKKSPIGSVYPDLPLKSKQFRYFLDVNQCLSNPYMEPARVVSHGLWHLDHTKISRDLAEASISSSCSLLKTNIFVPPFNKWNEEVSSICNYHGIRLVKSEEEGWRSFEHNEFDPTHDKWYFHSWKWNEKSIRNYLQASKKVSVW